MRKYIFLCIILSCFIMIIGCDKNSAPIVFKKSIKYKVSGSSDDLWIQYVDELGYYKQFGSKVPWEHTFKAKPKKYLYLSARNNKAEGDVKVEVFQGNKLVFSSKEEVPYGVAVVSGYVK